MANAQEQDEASGDEDLLYHYTDPAGFNPDPA